MEFSGLLTSTGFGLIRTPCFPRTATDFTLQSTADSANDRHRQYPPQAD